jgi:NAD(P) transhydrogenase
MGAEFLEVDSKEDGSGAGGYAKEMSEEYKQKQAALVARVAKDTDIIITTALIPGKPAPRLISKEMVASMRPGSVCIDLAAEAGGNIETTVPGQSVRTPNGVTCVGYTDLPSRCAGQASAMFANNVTNFVLSMNDKSGTFRVDPDADEAIRGALITSSGSAVLSRLSPTAPSAAPQTTPSISRLPRGAVTSVPRGAVAPGGRR